MEIKILWALNTKLAYCKLSLKNKLNIYITSGWKNKIRWFENGKYICEHNNEENGSSKGFHFWYEECKGI